MVVSVRDARPPDDTDGSLETPRCPALAGFQSADDQPWGQREEAGPAAPGGRRGRALPSGRAVCGSPELHRCIALPAERLLGAHPQGPSRDVCAHMHLCACALGGVGVVGGGCQGRVPAERLLGPHPRNPQFFTDALSRVSITVLVEIAGTRNTCVRGEGVGPTSRGPRG